MEATVFEQAAQAYAQYGWMGLVGVLLTAVVGIYKTDALQRMLPARAQWSSLPPFARAALVFVFSFLGVGVLAYAKTGAMLAAIGAGIQAALVAMGGKAVIDSVTAPVKPPPLDVPRPPPSEMSSIKTKLPSPGNL